MKFAIIGYSSHLPNGSSVSSTWNSILEGKNSIEDISEDRLNVGAYYDPDPKILDKTYCKRGGFIPPYNFIPRNYNMNIMQLEDCDSNQLLSLKKVSDCLKNAGLPLKEKKNMGCILGIGGGQKIGFELQRRMGWANLQEVLNKSGLPDNDIINIIEKFKAHFPMYRLDSFPGSLGNVVSGRIAKTFNLNGMNCVVDAACASSHSALRMAMDEIRCGNCDTMITGSTCTDNSITMYMSFSKTPVFTKEKNLCAYDEKSSGMLIGEGSVMFIIKRLDYAERDNNKIYAVINSCTASSDGSNTSGIYTPSVEGQMLAYERAYKNAGISPEKVTMLEGHGTGTKKGDLIELTGMSNFFKNCNKEQIAVGSIKSNIGHLKACAGFAGMLKAVLSLQHKCLPMTINCDNPSLDNMGPLYINTDNRPWITLNNEPRVAGISAFGFGGTNWHTVISEYEHEHVKL